MHRILNVSRRNSREIRSNGAIANWGRYDHDRISPKRISRSSCGHRTLEGNRKGSHHLFQTTKKVSALQRRTEWSLTTSSRNIEVKYTRCYTMSIRYGSSHAMISSRSSFPKQHLGFAALFPDQSSLQTIHQMLSVSSSGYHW